MKNTFQEMSLSTTLLNALEQMHIKSPTAVQKQAIPMSLEGKDFIAVAQTGSGKTLAFALPTLAHLEQFPENRALVLVPTREMAQQTQKVFQSLTADLPVSTCLVIGGTPGAKQTSQLKKNPRLIIATPGRLYDHLLQNKLLLKNVSIIVIDEAERMLDMGFLPQLKNIKTTLRGKQQTMMFSASLNKNVEAIAKLFMSSDVPTIRLEMSEKPVSTLEQKVYLIDSRKKKDRLLDVLNQEKNGVIVFTGNQQSCEDIGFYLKEYGYKTDFTHGGLSQGHRNRVIREFRDGIIRVMVATDMLARGLDVAHVDHVVNFDLPFEPEDFLHRIGRTARAGRTGKATTFVTTSDVRSYKKLKPYLDGAVEIKDDPNFSFSAQRNFDKAKQKAKAQGLSPQEFKKINKETKPKKDRYKHLVKSKKQKTTGRPK